MILYQGLLLLCVVKTGNAGNALWRNPPGIWRNLPGDPGRSEPVEVPKRVQVVLCPSRIGEMGAPGSPGIQGYPGAKGEKGEAMLTFSRPPPGTECRCPIGPPGERGEFGEPGYEGRHGEPGIPGKDGDQGDPGVQGLPGMPGAPGILPRHPPNQPDTMFIPVTFNGKVPKVMCHHVRKQAFVPGVPHDWLGWYETGKSGYLTFGKWLYFSSRFQCPCSVPIPPGPTPSPDELLRLL